MTNYHLQPGTFLDEKYTIKKVIGEGGFGITYEAENSRVGMKVAIKELYCKDYIHRDIDKSNEVLISYEESQKDFEKAKKRFLKEAKVLSQFHNEAGIVHILDYFEENGTAYIVMNYIEGVTLDCYLKEHGTMNWVDMLKLMRPIMLILQKLHEKGIIHRDISTNNIMIAEDGTANLIDFGATKDLMLTTNTNTTVVYSKRGYTPLEQLVENGKVGPWSDIYATMAVCYECMTGSMPPDVLQRSVLDEYKTLKECKIKAPAALDSILLKGLNVDYTKRYQSIEELLVDVDALLDATANPQKKKKKIFVCIATLLCTILCTGSLVYYFNREKILFKGVETEEFCYYLEEHVSDEDYKQNVNMLKERIEAFVGDEPYVFDVKNDVIRCVVPRSCFDGYDMKRTIEGYFLMDRSDIRFFVYEDGLTASTYNASLFDDVSEVSYSNGNVDIAFSDDISDENKKLFDENDMPQLIWSFEDTYCSVDLEKTEGDNYRLKPEVTENVDRLIACILNQKGQINKYSCQMEIQTNWESVDNAYYVGKGQCDVEKFKGNYVTLQYTYLGDYSEGEKIDIIKDVKNRLDIIGCPYAFGESKGDSFEITIRVFQKDYVEDLFGMLVLDSYNINICDGWYKPVSFGEKLTLMKPFLFEQDKNQLMISVKVEEVLEKKYEAYMKKLETNGLDSYSVMLGDFVLFEGGTFKDGTFTFQKYNIQDGTLTGDNDLYVELMEYICNSKEVEFSVPTLNIKTFSTRFKKVAKKSNDESKYAKRLMKSYEDIAENIRKIDGVKTCNIEDSWNSLGINLYIDLEQNYNIEDSKSLSDFVSQVTMTATKDNRGMLFNSITIQIVSESNEKMNAGKIRIKRETMVGEDTPYYVSITAFEDKESKALKELEKALTQREEYKDIIIEYNDLSGV